MSHHLERAQLLLQQSRPAEAAREAQQALLAQPEHPLAHALLALCQSELGHPEAVQSAQTAVSLLPDVAYFHHVLAQVLHRLERDREARVALDEAIRLDPEGAEHFALLSSIHLARRDWAAALAAAEQALALDPEHVPASNLRAMALVRLGRREEAVAAAGQTLERAPQNAIAHANQGWNHLHRSDPARAQEHFREALRLQPDLEYARQGMLEALKARNPVYRLMLAYFLWMGRLSTQLQWAFLIVTFFGVRAVRSLGEQHPQLNVVLWPALVLFYLFIYLSWTARPLFNLLLRLDAFGSLVLSRDERLASTWFAAPFLLALGTLIWWPLGGGDLALLLTIVGAILSITVAATFGKTGRSRLILASLSGLLALLALGAIALLYADNPGGMALLSLFFFGFLGFQIVANIVKN